MNGRILDEPTKFYLEHKEQIDEWLTLPDKALAAADDFYKTLADPLEEKLVDLEGSPEYYHELDDVWRQLFFLLPDWRHADFERPLIGIGLEWNPKRHGFGQIRLGIRVEVDVPNAKILRDSLRDRLPLDGYGHEQEAHWSARRSVPPNDDHYWTDLNAYAEELIDAAVHFWERTWRTVDRVFGSWAAEYGAGELDGVEQQ